MKSKLEANGFTVSYNSMGYSPSWWKGLAVKNLESEMEIGS